MENLPYLMAVMKELLRWKAQSPLGIPHRLVEDDEYEGWFLFFRMIFAFDSMYIVLLQGIIFHVAPLLLPMFRK